MKFLRWIGSAIEDKRGAISSKRLAFYWLLFMFYRAMSMPDVNEIWLWGNVGLIFGLAGLTIPEWFSNIKKDTTQE